MRNIGDILNDIEVLELTSATGDLSGEITDIESDSRKVIPGGAFIAISGFDCDGHTFIEKAIDGGARVIIYEKAEYKELILSKNVTGVRIANTREATPILARNFFENPSEKLNLVGVTGTNGKTTIATLLYRLFTNMGYCCGLLSTIANFIDKERFETTNTTSDPITINRLLRKLVDKGGEYCFMEVSSHSLHQGRVAGLHFKGGIFTNLTHDHLDYHKTFAEYIKCKKILFDNLPKGSFAITNYDDRNGEVMLQNTKAEKYRYSVGSMADFRIKIIESSIEGSLIEINGTQVWTKFIGKHNAYNIGAVYGTAVLLGADKEEVLVGLSALDAVAGRLEYIKGGNDITAVIDYAHTPDALENVLKTLKEISCGNQVIALFGCGGNRDKTKRSEMGAVCAKYADRLVVTSDNPRFENPYDIIEDIKKGLDNSAMAKSIFICDRAEAIRTAIMTAPKGAIVLLAGKGHEDYQIINGVKSHFDDKEEAIKVLNQLNQLR
ncbi:MAG: UDP-N-acetylmuramoyl-L-alanyl-D-glutamate--2,6-diaminopimelate ligase [Bacteroidales bacterium]|nr:UDP-N-acetylmuramoyl-L-alanyl-D-glutamate--2,6-diaminopimelate ligase [Bacteroidales bacterium]MBQ5748025.1 UDP-N-acetylmuramoyl-L-alanyl-D-glutamate--2,6-diaminopimelate ligase [Bacteroidales bacterium]